MYPTVQRTHIRPSFTPTTSPSQYQESRDSENRTVLTIGYCNEVTRSQEQVTYVVNVSDCNMLVRGKGSRTGDVFVVVPSFNTTLRIETFDNATDRLDVSGFTTVLGMEYLRITRGSVVISLRNQQTVVLLNLYPEHIDKRNFIFFEPNAEQGDSVLSIILISMGGAMVALGALYIVTQWAECRPRKKLYIPAVVLVTITERHTIDPLTGIAHVENSSELHFNSSYLHLNSDSDSSSSSSRSSGSSVSDRTKEYNKTENYKNKCQNSAKNNIKNTTSRNSHQEAHSESSMSTDDFGSLEDFTVSSGTDSAAASPSAAAAKESSSARRNSSMVNRKRTHTEETAAAIAKKVLSHENSSDSSVSDDSHDSQASVNSQNSSGDEHKKYDSLVSISVRSSGGESSSMGDVSFSGLSFVSHHSSAQQQPSVKSFDSSASLCLSAGSSAEESLHEDGDSVDLSDFSVSEEDEEESPV